VKSCYRVAAFVCLGFLLGNLAYQFFTARDWQVALDRTFFQVVAVFVVTWLNA
jgi:hypothetical protein